MGLISSKETLTKTYLVSLEKNTSLTNFGKTAINYPPSIFLFLSIYVRSTLSFDVCLCESIHLSESVHLSKSVYLGNSVSLRESVNLCESVKLGESVSLCMSVNFGESVSLC